LRAELPPQLFYHNVEHTEEDVLPAALRLAHLSQKTDPDDLHLLEVAAAFHDIGQIEGSLGHELVGIEVVSRVLPQFGFGPEEIERVAGMILATRLPQTPLNEEQAILCDADLDSLGRDDFFPISKALWREREACGLIIPWQAWLANQLQFLQSHQYFTPAARTLRQAGKLRNIALLERLIRGEPVPEWMEG
jgi:uncharacterized protein